MFAGEWNVLSRPNNKVVGPNGVLEGTAGDAGIISPTALDGLALWLDSIDQNSLLASDGSVIEDGEAVALWSDKSGNSAENCLVLNGVAGNYASTPDSAALDVAGDIEIIVHCSHTSVTPASNSMYCSKRSGIGQRTFALFLRSTGILSLNISTDGSVTASYDSTVAIPFSNYEIGYIRVTRLSSSGNITFYTSSDGSIWTQLGAVVSSMAGALFSSTASLSIGRLEEGDTNYFSGAIYQVTINSGIGGTTVFDADFTAQAKLATSFTEDSSNAATVTINTSGATGARISGARDLYQGTVANRPVFLKHNGENYGYLNGATGNYFSTPDSAALDITGNLDIIVRLSPLVWNGGVTSRPLVTKWNASTNNKSYGFQLANNGQLQLIYSINGTTTLSSNSVAHGIPNGQEYDVRVVRISSTGLISFYKKLPEDTSWTLVSQSMGTSGALYSGASQLAIVNYGDVSSTNAITGNLYRVWIWNGLSDSGGTLAFDFNPQSYVSGSTFLDSAGGATITLNDGAHIVTRTGLYFDGSNDYLKSASFSLSQPESVYFVGEQVTWTNGDALIDGDAANGLRIPQSTTTPNIGIRANPTAAVAENSEFTLKSSKIASAVFNGASSTLRINRGTATTGDCGANDANGFTVGASGAGSSLYANIFVHEILVYDTTAQSTATQDRVALYAGKKWGFST